MSIILIVEDEQVVRETLRDNLQFEGYETLEAENLNQAANKVGNNLPQQPDIILLDINLPDGDGITLLLKWRKMGIKIPVVVCTVKDREIDVIRALDSGADDYVTKPFRIRELLARIRTVLRRNDQKVDQEITLGFCRVNFPSREVFKNNQSVVLTATEWSLLEYFYRNRNQVVTRDQILEAIWGTRELYDSRALDVHIGRLRKKIEDGDSVKVLETVRGMGFRMRV
ncbi:MAG: response regulator transcription factor [Candidatus Riflebacteria bacterium]|nr:response regulator transcription factor [Candidatus Riflebacteria bacterium]